MAFDNAELSTLYGISTAYRLVVPEFQRGYAWVKDQWAALWHDAAALVQRQHADHYAGAIMIRRIGNRIGAGSTAEPVELIDGQQRLITMSLMLRALDATAFPIEFRDNLALQIYYDYHALGADHLRPELEKNHSFYSHNLAGAADFFHSKAKNIDAAHRAKLVDALLRRFKIFVLAIQPSFDVHVAFETINNRGKPLSTLEKLKNRLIFLASNAEDDEAGRAAVIEVHRNWKGIYSWLGRGTELLDDDEFLRAHSLGWFRHEKKADWLIVQLFDDEFAADVRVEPSSIERYVQSLQNAALWWYYLHLHEPRRLPPEVRKCLLSLERVPSASFRPVLLWALILLSSKDRGLIAKPTLLTDWGPFVKLATQAERFAVLVLLANDRPSNIGQSDFNRMAHSLAHADATVSQRAPMDAVRLAVDHVEAMINNLDDDGEKFVDPRFEMNGYFDAEQVAAVAADRLRKRTGFYKWQFSKLVIYRWEEWLRGDRGVPQRESWETLSWDDSVEHIYPQNPKEEWSEDIKVHGNAEALRKSVVNSLGNLLFVSGSRNPKLSNRPYRSSATLQGKRELYREGSYSESQLASLCPKWTIVQIAARGIAMMRLAEKTWHFELVGRDESLTAWLPILFGDSAEHLYKLSGDGTKTLDGRALRPWVEKFEKKTA